MVAAAFAQRPTEGGTYAFDPTDTVASWDEPTGVVRVHYSVDGPNVTKLADVDVDGVPDFAQDVAVTAAAALAAYADAGFLPPLSEADMGLSELGGSGAFDFYLVDFNGDADGHFGVDRCTGTPPRCSGYMVMENDFRGYGYPDLHEAVTVLTSHEQFHAVQAAYANDEPVWFSEGTAVWAERYFEPDVEDFTWFAQVYLDDAGRSIDRPPGGPVPAFAYSTALFWDFLTLRHDPSLLVDLLEATETSGAEFPIPLVEDVLAAREDTLRDAWIAFASKNLATGDRAGAVTDGYPYAADLDGVTAEAEGAGLDDDNRFYPLATTYYRLDHAGGPLVFGIESPAPELAFALHPVEGGADDGPVLDAVVAFDGATTGSLGDLPAGGYWLVGTYPDPGTESLKRRFCLGSEAFVDACFPAVDTGDTGVEDPGGCACDTSGAPSPLLVLGALALASRRRRPLAR